VGQELVVPGTGELVDLDDEVACVNALSAIGDFEQLIREAKRELTAAVVARSKLLGVKTFKLPDGRKASLTAGAETVYDAEAVEEGLRAAGMPEDRIREIVQETVTYRVRAVEAKRAAAANPEYARVVDEAKRVEPKTVYVNIK
jgi:hypothetical protein